MPHFRAAGSRRLAWAPLIMAAILAFVLASRPMLDALLQGLSLVLQWNAFSLMLVGMALGFVVGLLPGIGGAATLALMLPFVFKMTPVEAFAFLLGMHSVAATTGDITSILFGVPGEGLSAATVVDGHPMAKRGEAARALGAALMSSLVGAIGAIPRSRLNPHRAAARAHVRLARLFMITVMGIACITSLSGMGTRAQIKGIAMGLLGLLLATIGQERQSGILRFDFGFIYLWEGLDLIPVLVGIFAIPEIIDLAVRRTAIAGNAPAALAPAPGKDQGRTFRHFWLVVRCSPFGVFVGILPGAGGGVAQWMAYAHAAQSAKNAAERGASAPAMYAACSVPARRTTRRRARTSYPRSRSACRAAARWRSCSAPSSSWACIRGPICSPSTWR